MKHFFKLFKLETQKHYNEPYKLQQSVFEKKDTIEKQKRKIPDKKEQKIEQKKISARRDGKIILPQLALPTSKGRLEHAL